MKYKIKYQQKGKIFIKTLQLKSVSNLEKKLEEFENIIEIRQLGKKDKKLFLKNQKQELYLFFKQLHMMLGSHLHFNEALILIAQSNKNDTIKEIIKIIQQASTQNYPLDTALSKYQNMIGAMPILFLKQGLQNGTIKESIESITHLMEKEIAMKKSLLQKLRYPFFLILSLIISLGMIFIYVVPNFEFIFHSLGDELPTATKFLLLINYTLQNYWHYAIAVMGSLFFLLWILLHKYKLYFDRLVLKAFPFISKVVLEYQIYKLFLALYVVVHSKYRFQNAIETSIQTITNLYLKQILEQIEGRIKNGESIADAFSKFSLFDPIVIKLLYTAENTSQYETILLDITNYYQQSFEERLQKLSELIEPAIIFIIALVVLWLILAIMVPIWKMGAVGL